MKTIVSLELKRKHKTFRTREIRETKGRRRYKFFQESGKKFYGDGANQPDMSKETFAEMAELLIEELKQDQENRIEIEKTTRNKLGFYQEIISQLLLASNFYKVCKRKPTASCANLVKNILYPSISSADVQFEENEIVQKAVKALEKKTGLCIDTCGLFIDENIPYLGATPTGTVGSDTIVQIFCPEKISHISEKQFMDIPSYKNIFDKQDTSKMNINNMHYFEVQGNLHITKRKFCKLKKMTNFGEALNKN